MTMTKPPVVTANLQRLLQAVADVEAILRRGAVIQSAITLLKGISTELKSLSSAGPIDPKEIERLVASLDSAANALIVNAPTGTGYTSPSISPGGAPPKGR
jgi:cell division FtsZ-interacting protein ZapD